MIDEFSHFVPSVDRQSVVWVAGYAPHFPQNDQTGAKILSLTCNKSVRKIWLKIVCECINFSKSVCVWLYFAVFVAVISVSESLFMAKLPMTESKEKQSKKNYLFIVINELKSEWKIKCAADDCLLGSYFFILWSQFLWSKYVHVAFASTFVWADCESSWQQHIKPNIMGFWVLRSRIFVLFCHLYRVLSPVSCAGEKEREREIAREQESERKRDKQTERERRREREG